MALVLTQAEVDTFNRHQMETLKPYRCPNDGNVLEGRPSGAHCTSCHYNDDETHQLVVAASRRKARTK